MSLLPHLRPLTRLSTLSSTRPFSLSTPKLSSSSTQKSNLDAKQPDTVGRAFESDGKIGSAGEQVGGPFASDGKIGEKFTKEGAIGGKAQEMAESKSVFDKDGAVGKEFQAGGKIGGAAQAVGGPFDKDGAIGKQFTDKGAVGGTVQENMGSKKE